ncbi:MAG TPA: ATP-binding protein [Desulfuromonadaceae bacterium]
MATDAPRTGILVCEILRREVEEALAAENLSDVEVTTFPCECGGPGQLGEISGAIVPAAARRYDTLLVLACDAGAAGDRQPATAGTPAHVVVLEGGFSLFLPSATIRHFQARGAHLVTPGWLVNWRAQLAAWGFDRQSGREFFAESCGKLLLLDTGITGSAVERMGEMAAYLDRPFEVVPVGLDMLRLSLVRHVRPHPPKSHGGRLLPAEELLSADNAMVFDMMSRLASLDSEECVVRNIFDLFAMFCAPGLQCYLPFRDGRPEAPIAHPQRIAVPADAIKRLSALDEAYAWPESGAGFMVRIHREQQLLGALLVDDIPLPERREDYLNMTFVILPVLALAIANARNAELKRERSLQLKAANEELDSFAYAVSHDLRAPLRAMNGFSQALIEDYGEALAGEARQYLEQIILASRSMGSLIDGLLTLSRSTRGDLNCVPVDLSAMVSRIRTDLERAEPERRVEWEVAAGMRAGGDSRMLEVVLRNLLGNAWKYTAGTPAPHIRVYAEERDGSRCFCVADNGAGFDMRHAARLFKPFQRLHRQDEFPGIGIGLATVQRIIHRHGGEICAEAEPGKGALFRFSLAASGVPSRTSSLPGGAP